MLGAKLNLDQQTAYLQPEDVCFITYTVPQGKACKLHFEVAPLKITRASKQYMYDDVGNEYLDCINNVSHGAGQEQMGKLATSQGFLTDKLSMYAKRLVESLPESLCVCFFLNSGSEANDLALRMAKAYTGNEDVIVVDNSYHGNIGNLLDVSPLNFKKNKIKKKDSVHVVPTPDTFRGKYREAENNVGVKYAKEVQKTIQDAHDRHRGIAAFFSEVVLVNCGIVVPPKPYFSQVYRVLQYKIILMHGTTSFVPSYWGLLKIAAFISEPLMTSSGVIVPPKPYLKLVYRYVREAGGVCIADEVQIGLGRTGENYWGFQSQDIVPDILTCGKPLGNGYPMAVVITRRDIADSLRDFTSSFGGNPVACAVGLAVLDVIRNEQLISSAKCVGRALVEGFRNILPRHPMLGDVRGQGLAVGIEIVVDKESRKPAKEAAELLSYKLKQEKILLSNEGPDKNVMTLLPPMCFTCDNARYVISKFDACLSEIESGACPDLLENAQGSVQVETTELNIPLDIVSGVDLEGDDSDDDPNCKRARYEDMD